MGARLQRRITGILLAASVAVLTACTGTAGAVPEDVVVEPTDRDLRGQGDAIALSDPAEDHRAEAASGGIESVEAAGPVVHDRGFGPKGFIVSPKDLEGAAGLRVYVNCSPAAEFRASFGTHYSGVCSPTGASPGTLPIGHEAGILTLEVPEDTEYWLLVVPTRLIP